MERRSSLLVVEDEDVLRELVAQFLRMEGFDVLEARDGGEGVQAFLDHGPFDLMLVDIKMPVFNGVEVCRRVKQVAPDQKMMVCSAAIVREHEEALHAVGVTHFLTKPYHPEALLAQVRLMIGPGPSAAAAPAPPPAVLATPRPA